MSCCTVVKGIQMRTSQRKRHPGWGLGGSQMWSFDFLSWRNQDTPPSRHTAVEQFTWCGVNQGSSHKSGVSRHRLNRWIKLWWTESQVTEPYFWLPSPLCNDVKRLKASNLRGKWEPLNLQPAGQKGEWPWEPPNRGWCLKWGQS